MTSTSRLVVRSWRSVSRGRFGPHCSCCFINVSRPGSWSCDRPQLRPGLRGTELASAVSN